MPVRTAEEFRTDAVKIRPDGSQNSPDVVSEEQAKAIQDDLDKRSAALGEKVTPLEIEDDNTPMTPVKPAAKKTDPAESPAATTEDPLKDVPDETLQAVLDKVEKKEELTADEQAIYDAAVQSQEEAAPEPFALPENVKEEEVTIGGEKKSLTDLFNEFQKEEDLDLSGLPYKQARSLLDGYIAKKHDAAWKAENTRKSQDVAKRSSEVRKAEEQLKRSTEIEAQRLTKIVKKLEETKVLAAENPEEIDIYGEDGRVDIKKLNHYNAVVRAQESVKELTEQETEAKQNIQTFNTERLYTVFEAYQEANPAFQTTKPIRQVIAEFEQAKTTGSFVDNDDMRKARAFYRVLDHSISTGVPFDTAAQDLIDEGAFKNLKPVNGAISLPNSQRQSPSNKTRDEIIKEIARKQRGAKPSLDGKGGVVRARAPKKGSVGSAMRAASDEARGVGSSNPALDKLEEV